MQVQYVGPVGPKLRELMPPSISIPELSNIPRDEVHLIMEYSVGDTWGNLQAPVANRFISSFDESNSKMTMLESFFMSLESFRPDLIIMSGLHLLEGQTKEFFNEKIKTLKDRLHAVPKYIPVHLELASMSSGSFLEAILDQVTLTCCAHKCNEFPWNKVIFSQLNR